MIVVLIQESEIKIFQSIIKALSWLYSKLFALEQGVH